MQHPPRQPAVFLDRDGTLNVDTGYLDSPDRLEIIPGAIEAVKLFNQMNRKVIVVTNQSGIARGYFDHHRLAEIHQRMQLYFSRSRASIDAFYYCPYHPDFGTPEERLRAGCRKPNSSMYDQAAREHNLNLNHSVMIGDKYSDIEGGRRLDMLSILVLTGEGQKTHRQYQDNPSLLQPDFVVRNIWEAARIVQEQQG